MKLIKNNLAEIRVSYYPKKMNLNSIKSSLEAADLLRKIYEPGIIEFREEFIVLYLNRGNYVIGWSKISTGGISGTIADPRIILGIALKSAAVSLIISHNHPSRNTIPSNSDREITDKLNKACNLLDLTLLDHIILTADNFMSFSDEGYL